MRRLVLGVAAALLGAVATAAGGFGWVAFGDRTLPAAAVTVTIARGSTLGAAAQALAAAGALGHPRAFRLLARFRQADGALQAGVYRIPPRQNTAEVLDRLLRGDVEAVWLTIPEGFTVREVARRLGEQQLADAAAFARYAATAGIDLDGRRTPSLEGYLFPSTYLIPVGATPEQIARIFTDEFRRELPPDAATRARALGVTVPQAIVLASLVEREAKKDDERPLMAGVYYNRLRAGMPLQVDATIEYAFAEHHTVITLRDLRIDSPYNTYRRTGLPPTPIANPGKASIDAAFAPRRSPYLYYVYKGGGHHAFARTFAEHTANVNRYLNTKE